MTGVCEPQRLKDLRTCEVLGYPIVTSSIEQTICSITRQITEATATCRWLACLNPHSYAVAKSDTQFRSALLTADWLVPDGIGIVGAARVLGCGFTRRVTGFDVFTGVMGHLNECRGRAFFLGGTDLTLERIQDRVAKDYPSIRVTSFAPVFAPEFSVEQVTQMVQAVNAAAPDVVWVGLTAPKQEKLLATISPLLDSKFAAGIGAVFDFYGGTVQRPGKFFQATGLEWLPRLVAEPGRLWRRTFVSAPVFLRDVVAAKFATSRRRDR